MSTQAIAVSVSSTAADLQLDSQQASAQPQQSQTAASSKHAALRPRPLVHRQPDPAAAHQFMQESTTDELTGEGVTPGGAASAAALSPAPRITADPAHAGQQLAGWTRIAAPGDVGEGDVGDIEGLQDEDLLGDGLEDQGDMMDEEEWV